MHKSVSVSYVLPFSRIAVSDVTFAREVFGVPVGEGGHRFPLSSSVVPGYYFETDHNSLFYTPCRLNFSSCAKQNKHCTLRDVLNPLNHSSNYKSIRSNVNQLCIFTAQCVSYESYKKL